MAGHADNLADGLNEFSHTLLATVRSSSLLIQHVIFLIASFPQARAIQETRSQVAHFEAKLRQVRHERDEAIASMHELERRVQDMQSKMESLKAAVRGNACSSTVALMDPAIPYRSDCPRGRACITSSC